MTEIEPEIIYSEHCCEYELDGHLLTVEIYKSDQNPEWILEVVNENNTSIVWDIPFIADGMAWRAFQATVEEEGIKAFLDDDEKPNLVH
jgi:hypothetical protein